MPHQPLSRRSRNVAGKATSLVGVAALAVGLLAGCAAPTTPSPVVTHHPVAHPTSPVTTQPATPPVLLNNDCSQLVSLPVIQAGVGSPAVVADNARIFSDTSQFRGIPFQQSGAIDCSWQDPTGGYALDVQILPNATGAFATEQTLLGEDDDASRVSGVPQYGDHSWSQCYNIDDPWYGGCDFMIQVGTYWLNVSTQNSTLTTPYPPPPAEKILVDDLVAKVRTLAPFRRWVPQTDSLDIPTTCASALPVATVASATGLPTIAVDSDIAEEPALILDGTYDVTGSLHCAWAVDTDQDGRDLFFDIVPGSTWAWPASSPLPSEAAAAGMPSVSGVGTVAYAGCATDEDGLSCGMDVLADHTWFELREDGPGSTVAALTTLSDSVLATIHFRS